MLMVCSSLSTIWLVSRRIFELLLLSAESSGLSLPAAFELLLLSAESSGLSLPAAFELPKLSGLVVRMSLMKSSATSLIGSASLAVFS